MKRKPRKPRNWQAVNAQFRTSAGAIPDQKKEEARTACRSKVEEEDEGPEPAPICKVWGTCHHPELCKDRCWDEDLLKEKE
jgi:hypothetical protein